MFKFYDNKSFYRLCLGFTLSLIRILSFLGKVKENLFRQAEMCMREIGKKIIGNIKKFSFVLKKFLLKIEKIRKIFENIKNIIIYIKYMKIRVFTNFLLTLLSL